MKVLFLHTDTHEMIPEYAVHVNLARHAPSRTIEPSFVWQSTSRSDPLKDHIDITPIDFGRDMSIEPRPSRVARATLMARQLPKALAAIFNHTKRTKPDFIYTSQRGRDVRLARMLSLAFKTPHIIHLHYNLGPWIRPRMLRSICGAKHMIAVSEFTRQTALLSGCPGENVSTLVNPVSMSFDTPNESPNKKRRELGYSDHTPLIVSVGRLDPGKGHIDLIEAFAEVVKYCPTARLLICGRSTMRNDYAGVLLQKVVELGLGDTVKFAGHRSDVRSIMRCANVFSLPTELEPFGLVFIEAAAEGLPSVAYYSGGVPEIIEHGETGLLCPPRDKAGLVKNLRLMIEEPDLARRMGEKARRRALAAFRPEQIASRWVEILWQFQMKAG